MTFPYLVSTYLPVGVKGLILCALFASLMSTVDSTFNSIATLWSIDIYKEYIKRDASDNQVVQTGKKAILLSFISGTLLGIVLLYIKFQDAGAAFTHTLNELRYYINCGIVVLSCAAIFLINPKPKISLVAFLLTVPLQFVFKGIFPEMNYFVRAMWVILSGFAILWAFSRTKFYPWRKLVYPDSKSITYLGLVMLISLVLLHIVFH